MLRFLTVPLFALTLSFTTQAQTTSEKKPPAKEAAKTANKKPADTKLKPDEPIDLDAFFKQGEENAKEGSSCDKPAVPAEPIA